MTDHRAACRVAADALVGFDGFIDHISDVVDQRQGPDSYTPFTTIADYGQRVVAAAGKSANIEVVVKQTKIGGNGPIMANAMICQGVGLTFVGNVGEADYVHPVFQALADGAQEVVPLGEPAVTTALEFTDGKIMQTRSAPLAAITADSVFAALGEQRWVTLLRSVAAVATVNWTQIMAMTDIWRQLSERVLPQLGGHRPLWFVDLADPAKRTRDDLRAAIEQLQVMQEHVDIVLGLNGSEGRQVIEALGGTWDGDEEDTDAARACCVDIRNRTGLHWVMVHLVASAACAGPDGAVGAAGFLCAKPLITTGAGDHFNAGFLSALLAGQSAETALLAGGATSGSYVRSGVSPTRADIAAFLRTYAENGAV
ncbi:MAG: PfkB family carbohydrate kinase [Planctomycetota bacterium]|jgi:hypothetical protein